MNAHGALLVGEDTIRSSNAPNAFFLARQSESLTRTIQRLTKLTGPSKTPTLCAGLVRLRARVLFSQGRAAFRARGCPAGRLVCTFGHAWYASVNTAAERTYRRAGGADRDAGWLMGGRSSIGRAPALQAGGWRFEPARLHSVGQGYWELTGFRTETERLFDN